MADTRYRLPNEVATQLQVSPSTLRRWSDEFADFLSESAGRPHLAAGTPAAHRRYTDEDLETLLTIKGLLAEGLTYIQVGKRLEALRQHRPPVTAGVEGEAPPVTAGVEGEAPPVTALGPSLRDAPFAPAISVLADTLHTVAEGQQLLLGSQQASRDLLTVVVQDNFNLKEENSKLRDRMLDLEREMSEMRRQEAAHREALEARLQQLEARLQQPRPQPAHPRHAGRPGCLGQLLGR